MDGGGGGAAWAGGLGFRKKAEETLCKNPGARRVPGAVSARGTRGPSPPRGRDRARGAACAQGGSGSMMARGAVLVLLLLGCFAGCDGLARLPSAAMPAAACRRARGGGLRLQGGDGEAPKEAAGAAPPPQTDGAASLMNLLHMFAGGGGAGAKKEEAPPSAADNTPNFGMGMSRSMKAMGVYNEIKASYDALYNATAAAHPHAHKSGQHAHPAEPRAEELAALHRVNAEKCLRLARDNGGIYNKAAQFAASLQGGAGDRGVPEEYIQALRVCTDSAPAKPFDVMDAVLLEEFGVSGRQLFKHIDETPIAAASLAQVHRAVLKDGREVAVKIIFPCLRRELASDFAVFKTLGAQIKPGGFDLTWMVRDFEQALAQELNFTAEAENSERCRRRLAHVPGVYVPAVVWEYTRSSVLVTEFVHGMVRLNDEEALIAQGLDRREVGHVVADVFSEMALCHGYMHGDPHLGNVYARKHKGRAELVILDHGLYHTVGPELREAMCRLLLACIERRRGEIVDVSTKLAGPLHRFLPLLLSPWFVFGGALTISDLRAAMRGQIPKTVALKEIGQCIESLHAHSGSVLGLLHSLGYTRGLLKALSFPEGLRLKSLAKYATLGLLPDTAEREGALADYSTAPKEVRTAISLSQLQVDVTMRLVVPALILWRILRPFLLVLGGFAAVTCINLLALARS